MKEDTIGGRWDSTMGRWQDWFNLVLGVWLIVAPFIGIGASNSDVAAGNSYVLGAAVAIFAIVALASGRVWEEWVNLVLAAWLIIAPFVLGFSDQTGAMWNHVIVGLLIGADALWAALQYSPQRMHHA